jgi:hypothetical protein
VSTKYSYITVVHDYQEAIDKRLLGDLLRPFGLRVLRDIRGQSKQNRNIDAAA